MFLARGVRLILLRSPFTRHKRSGNNRISSCSPSMTSPYSSGDSAVKRGKRDSSVGKKPQTLSQLFTPVEVEKTSAEEAEVGQELTGVVIQKQDLANVLIKFYQTPEIKLLAASNGLDSYLFHKAYLSFRKFCLESEGLPSDLHIVVCDILRKATHITDIYPYFLRHARQVFPHLECMDDLKKISDLTEPTSWYTEARALKRKIIFHAGPTNSGKTYRALERFLKAESGVYCGPLKLLAAEVFKKSNERGTPCDLVTGEERKFALGEETPASHVSCTVEMTSVDRPYEVAVIDEIQLMKDPTRGWAWTRALLGIAAQEIHVCGEEAAVDLVLALAITCDDEFEVHHYKRLTELKTESTHLGSLDNVKPGDCIVCFNKNDIYSVSRTLESHGKEAAVIYGSLPPGTKLAQAQKFNDPSASCKLLVATDAIGMGLNLSIKRVIFYSLIKPVINEKGEKGLDLITVSQALQIAGRAGRYGTQFDQGSVTTFKAEDLPILQNLLSQKPDVITKAGLHPTAEQIELYAFHLPSSSLSNLMNIFETICTVDDSLYFMCNMDDFKHLAEMIQHVPLPLRMRYLFCCAPINQKMPIVTSMFVKFARLCSRNEPVTYQFVARSLGAPFAIPKSIGDLTHLEAVFDVLDSYLWLSTRFLDLFPEVHRIRELQDDLDKIIQQGVTQITRLLLTNEISRGSQEERVYEDEDRRESDRTEISDDDDLLKPRLNNNVVMGRGKLTDRLVAQGLLTPSMLNQLRREWSQLSDNPEDRTKGRKKKRKG